MTAKTKEQQDCEDALARMRRAFDGKPRQDDVTCNFAEWIQEAFAKGFNARDPSNSR